MSAANKTGSTPAEAAAVPESVPFDQRKPLHKAFDWSDPHTCELIPSFPAISFFNTARDITAGAVTALGLLERCQLDAEADEEGTRPLLSPLDQSNLMRLATGALKALNAMAEENTNWINKHGPGWKARELQERAKRGQR